MQTPLPLAELRGEAIAATGSTSGLPGIADISID
jgi:hypothetical protein